MKSYALRPDTFTLNFNVTLSGTLGVLDVASHAYQTILRSHTDAVLALAVDPDPTRQEFASVSADGTIRVWSITNFEQVCVIQYFSLYSVCIQCEGFAKLTFYGTIRVWSITNFEQLYEFKAFGETARSLAYHPCYDGTAEAAVAKFQVKSIDYSV